MNEHAGLGCALSVLIVVGFTIVFHEKERPSGPGPHPASAQAQANANSSVRPDHPWSEASPSPSKPIAATRVEPDRTEPRPALTSTWRERLPIVESVNPPPATVSLVSSRPKSTTKPTPLPPIRSESPTVLPNRSSSANFDARRSSTTIITKGEKLVDVAIRVYGSPEATLKLWRANRDQLSSVDAPVSEGWLLRTP